MPSAIAAVLAVVVLSPPALADCVDVNSGAFDRSAYTPLGSGVLNTSTGFAVGDEITFTVSGLTGSSFELINGALDTALLIQPLSGSETTVSYTVTGSNSDTTLNTYMLVQAIPYEITIVATCAAAGGGAAQAVHNFIAARMDAMLLDDPAGARLRDRSGGGALSVSAAHGATSLAFSQSLAQARRTAALAAIEGDGEPVSPWDVWIDGRFSTFDGDDGGGHFGQLSFGGDYRLTGDMMLGVMAQIDWASNANDSLDTNVNGSGWMVGPYLSARIHDAIYLDLRAAWGRSSNVSTVGDATGDFDTTRWLVKGTVSGNWTHDGWRFTPMAELAYMSERSEAFTDSGGATIAGESLSLGRLQFGPEVGYRFSRVAGAFIEPFAAIRGVWDFDNPYTAFVDGEPVAAGGAFRGRLVGGVNIGTAGGLSLRGLASWDGLGASGASGYTLQGAVHIPLN